MRQRDNLTGITEAELVGGTPRFGQIGLNKLCVGCISSKGVSSVLRSLIVDITERQASRGNT